MKKFGKYTAVITGLTLMLTLFWFILNLFLSTMIGFIAYLTFQLLFMIIIIFNLILFFKRRKNRASKVIAIILSINLSVTFFLIALMNGMSPYISEYLYDKNISKSPVGKIKLYKDVLAMTLFTSVDLSEFENKKVGNKTFYKKNHLSIKIINNAIDGIKKEEGDYGNIFGGLSKAPVSIIFYSRYNQMASDNHLTGEHSGGYLPSKNRISIYVPPNRINDSEYIEKISAHEYSHFLFNQFTQEHSIPLSRVPVWLNEGVAQYIEQKSIGTPLNENILNGQGLIPFEKLMSVGGWNSYLDNNYDPYDQSALFITYLINKNGFDSLNKLFLNLKDNSFEKAFKKSIGEEFGDYGNEFFKKLDRAFVLWNKVNNIMLKNNQSQSLKILDNIHNLFPGNSVTIKTEAENYIDQGNYKKAIEYGRSAEMINPNNIEINEFLALNLLYTNPKKALVEINTFKSDITYHQELAKQIKILNIKISHDEPYQGFKFY